MENTYDWLDPIFATYQQFTVGLKAYLPTLLAALVVLVIGFVAAWLLKRIVLRVSGGASLLARRMTGQNLVVSERLPWPVSTIIANFVFWLTIVFFLAVTARILGLPGIAAWLTAAAGVFPRILAAAAIILIGYSIAHVTRDIIQRMPDEEDEEQHPLLPQSAFITINAISVIVGLKQLGVDLAFVELMIAIVAAAIVGGMAFAFALGAGASIDNVIAGYYVRKTYGRGQLVQIGAIKGEILDIKPTAIVIDSPDGRALVPAKLFHQEVSILLDAEDNTI